ncbi:uncharacterized protein LOC129906742 [Episyrphus balteatus]|uniref:uncharacterized protein LOC129906742 n=1 Tax=Episyrphus balteatus TaxID=286459 RepID=UPI00248623DD|nr:uncharacterized protein LOC129906742 [Episyrphus balteatus]
MTGEANIAKTLENLKTNRASTKGRISRIKTLLETKTLEFTELECRLGILESYFRQALNYQTRIEEASPTDTGRAEIEELYCSTKSKILSLMGNNRRSSIAPGDTTMSNLVPLSRLPLQKLPKFTGKYADYKNFIGLFKTLVHNDNSIAKIEKFNHLISCLSEQACGTIKSFQVTEENYSKAFARLEERYNKKGLIFMEYISSLFDLPKMKGVSASQLRNLVDDTSTLFDSLKSLATHEEICTGIIIHLVMSKVDTQTYNKWNESLDHSKLPAWDQCTKTLINRCQFLESKESKTPNALEVSSFPKSQIKKPSHVSLSLTKSICLYCKSSNHMIVDCNKFKNLRVYDCYKKAKTLSLCINCLSKGHGVKECSASKCNVCSDPHHILLHRYGETQPESSGSEAVAGRTRTSLLNSTFDDADSQIVLATVVVRVRNSKGEFVLARALLDSGS